MWSRPSGDRKDGYPIVYGENAGRSEGVVDDSGERCVRVLDDDH
jgi:hypothetical protein